MVEQLSELIRDKKATVGVVGLGYVGLPLVHAFVKAGYRSIGFDVDPAKVKLLQEGKSYIKHFSNDWIGESITQGKFAPTADMARLSEADAILIAFRRLLIQVVILIFLTLNRRQRRSRHSYAPAN